MKIMGIWGLFLALAAPFGLASEQALVGHEDDDYWQESDWADLTAEVPAARAELVITEVTLTRQQQLAEYLALSDAALAKGDWARAEYQLGQALAHYPLAHQIRLKLAALLYGRGELDEAREQLQQGLVLAPGHADMRLALARILAEQERYPAALAVLQGAEPALAEHLDYYSLKADMARRSGACDTAVGLYQRLLAHVPEVGAWWLSLGLCQRSLGQDFVPAYQRALASADLGNASLRFVQQQLEQHGSTQTH